MAESREGERLERLTVPQSQLSIASSERRAEGRVVLADGWGRCCSARKCGGMESEPLCCAVLGRVQQDDCDYGSGYDAVGSIRTDSELRRVGSDCAGIEWRQRRAGLRAFLQQ